MEYDKINNLLLSEDNESEVSKANRVNEMSEQLSKFVTREYVRVNSLSSTYNENKSIRFKTLMLRSNLCDYSDAYILVKGTITVTAPRANNGANNIRDKSKRPLILKNNAPFVSCITRINGELIEDADDLDMVMSMCNFWRALNIPLISCEVSLQLKWDKNCVIISLGQRDIGGGNRDNAPTAATRAINDCKLYVPAVTLSKDDEIKLLTNLKSGFKREIICNKYGSQMTTEAVNNNLNILIDPTFTNVNRLFVLAYQNADDRQSFSQFYLPNVMVKDYSVIIDKLAFFDLPMKTEEEAYEKIIDISTNNEYTTGNLLDYDYFKKHYKLIATDLSKQQVLQENEDLIQEINFIGKLEEAANVFIIIEKKENTILEFSQNLANVIYK